MEKAKLTKLGVNQKGFDLMHSLSKTMASQQGTVNWDKSGNIIIFDEVKIFSPEYSSERTAQ